MNGGSRDSGLAVLGGPGARQAEVAVVGLSRHSGEEAAMAAELEHARGDAVVVIDVDFQDPPEMIPALVAGWAEGFDVVCARRRAREGETRLKCAAATVVRRLTGSIGGPWACRPKSATSG